MLEVILKPWSLPEDFKRKIVSSNGRMVAHLHPPIELPFSDETLQKYAGARENEKSPRFRSNCRYNLPAWNRLSTEILTTVLPEYAQDEFYGFKNTILNPASDFFGGEDKTKISSARDYGHFAKKDEMPAAWCRINYHSPEDFYPVISEDEIKRPTIDKLFVQSYVTVFPYIYCSQRSDKIYNLESAIPIARALLSGKDITLETKDNRLRDGQLFLYDLVYIQVTNPTIKRMKKAILESNKLTDFFRTYSPELLKIAKSVYTALQKQEHVSGIRQAHRNLEKTYDNIRKSSGVQILEASGENAAVAVLNKNVTSVLSDANDLLKSLREHSNSALFSYAMQTEQKEPLGQSRSFHFS